MLSMWTQVQSLVRELGSHKLYSAAKKMKTSKIRPQEIFRVPVVEPTLDPQGPTSPSSALHLRQHLECREPPGRGDPDSP